MYKINSSNRYHTNRTIQTNLSMDTVLTLKPNSKARIKAIQPAQVALTITANIILLQPLLLLLQAALTLALRQVRAHIAS